MYVAVEVRQDQHTIHAGHGGSWIAGWTLHVYSKHTGRLIYMWGVLLFTSALAIVCLSVAPARLSSSATPSARLTG